MDRAINCLILLLLLAVGRPLAIQGAEKPVVLEGQKRQAGTGIRQGLWQNFSIADGLVGTFIYVIHQDRRGQLWFGTEKGVIRYDGSTFVNFTTADGLTDNRVRAIVEDIQGRLWFGTWFGGLSCFDGYTFTNYTREDGLPDNMVHALVEDGQGRLWIGTDQGGVCKFEGGRFTCYTTEDGLADNLVAALLEDSQGQLWIGTNNGVSRFDGTQFYSYDLPQEADANVVRVLLEDRQGQLWVGSDGGISRLQGEGFEDCSSLLGTEDRGVLTLMEDSRGGLWAGTWGGAIRFDGSKPMVYTQDDGLVSKSVLAILEDRQRQFWFGTWGGGLSRYDGESFVNYSSADGLASDDIQALAQDRAGGVWVGTLKQGLSRFDGQDFTSYSVVEGLVDDRVRTLIEDRQGDMWIGTSGGLSRYDGESFVNYTTADGLVHEWVEALLEDGQGHVWIGTSGGLSRFDGESFINYTTADGLAHGRVEALMEDGQGHVWIGTWDGGLSRFDGEKFVNYTTADGLVQDRAISLLEDGQGHVWIGTWDGGLSRFDGEKFVNYTTADGLSQNRVNRMVQDPHGQLWLATWNGVSRFDGRVFQHLLKRDGLASNSITELLQDREGNMWIATDEGLTCYRGYEVIPPPVVLTDIQTDRSHGPVERLHFPSSQAFVRFQFKGISLKTRPGQMVYTYRLRGAHEDWRQTRENEVQYTNLPRGSYIFEVKGVDRDLAYSHTPARVALDIHLPYERIGWLVALGVAVALLVWQGVRLVQRDQKLLASNAAIAAANRTLEQTVLDVDAANRAKSVFLANISHEIRTPMNAILGYAQLLLRSKELGGQYRHAVETIRRSGDHLLRLINDVLDISKIEAGSMELRSVDFDLLQTLSTLEVMFALRCDEKGLQWRLEKPPAEALLVRGDESKLSQALINLLSNGIKFTGEGTVTLQVKALEENHYQFAIIDTGQGISPDEQAKLFEPFQQGKAGLSQGGTGLGLAIAQRHIQLMGGQLRLESVVAGGSCFSFTLHLPPATGVPVNPQEQGEAQVERLAPGSSLRVLVVDDVADNRDILCQLLGEMGAQVQTASTGLEALETLAAQPADIVFLDIHMPVMDGRQALDRLRQSPKAQLRALKVVAVSASVFDHERRSFIDAGFDDFLAKPIAFEELCHVLRRQVDVAFEYVQQERLLVVEAEGAWHQLELPEEVYAPLLKAAELYNFTLIEEGLVALERLGPAQGRLAAHLRRLRQRHDIEGIISVLRGVGHA